MLDFSSLSPTSPPPTDRACLCLCLCGPVCLALGQQRAALLTCRRREGREARAGKGAILLSLSLVVVVVVLVAVCCVKREREKGEPPAWRLRARTPLRVCLHEWARPPSLTTHALSAHKRPRTLTHRSTGDAYASLCQHHSVSLHTLWCGGGGPGAKRVCLGA